MKTLITKLAFIILLQGFSGALFAHVELDYPDGGETFTVGQTVTIQWHIAIAHNTLNWDVLFSNDGGNSWEPIQMDLPPGSLSYTWTVPSDITSQARVSVIQDNSAQDYQDESPNFNIVLPAMPPALITGATNITIESDIEYQDDVIQDWLDNNGGASANAFCGDLVWSNDFINLSNDCGATGSAIVTFTATDPCGSTETVAIVTVHDTSPPVLNTAAFPVSVECDGNGNVTDLNTWLQFDGGAIAYDGGGNVTWGVSYIGVDSLCGARNILHILFTGSDECDNTVTSEATFSIEDHAAPVLQTPAQDIIIECGQSNTQVILQNWLLNNGGAIATDVCGLVTWTNNFPVVVDTCHASTIVPVTFTAVDDCGNTTVTNAIVNLMGPLGTTTPGLTDNEFKISPNPVSDILKVEFNIDESSIEHITLFDALGHPVDVFKQRTKQINIPVNGYAPGLYYLQVETTNGVATRKVVIE